MSGAPSRPPSIPMQRLQRADKWLGWLVCLCLQPLRWLRGSPSPSGPRDADLERVLMIKFWGIGSLVLLTPAVRALRKRHPRARLTLLTLRENEAFARGLEVFDEVLVLDVRARPGPVGWTRVLARIVQLLFVLRRARFQAVYDFEFFTRFSAFVSFATGAHPAPALTNPASGAGSCIPYACRSTVTGMSRATSARLRAVKTARTSVRRTSEPSVSPTGTVQACEPSCSRAASASTVLTWC